MEFQSRLENVLEMKKREKNIRQRFANLSSVGLDHEEKSAAKRQKVIAHISEDEESEFWDRFLYF